MASSLAVEWAKKGVRVNVLRYVWRCTPAILTLMHRLCQSWVHVDQAYQDYSRA